MKRLIIDFVKWLFCIKSEESVNLTCATPEKLIQEAQEKNRNFRHIGKYQSDSNIVSVYNKHGKKTLSDNRKRKSQDRPAVSDIPSREFVINTLQDVYGFDTDTTPQIV